MKIAISNFRWVVHRYSKLCEKGATYLFREKAMTFTSRHRESCYSRNRVCNPWTRVQCSDDRPVSSLTPLSGIFFRRWDGHGYQVIRKWNCRCEIHPLRGFSTRQSVPSLGTVVLSTARYNQREFDETISLRDNPLSPCSPGNSI